MFRPKKKILCEILLVKTRSANTSLAFTFNLRCSCIILYIKISYLDLEPIISKRTELGGVLIVPDR